MPNTIVTKSNHVIEAGHKLTLNEQRLVLSAIIKFGRNQFPKDPEFVITAKEFSEFFGIPLNEAYKILEEAASRLYERDINTYDSKAKIEERFRWIDKVEYWDEEEKVAVSFTPWIIPYLTMLRQQFTNCEKKERSMISKEELKTEIEKLKKMTDEAIDFSEILELDFDSLGKPMVGKFYRPLK